MEIFFDYFTGRYFKCDKNRVINVVNEMNELLKSQKERGKPLDIISASLMLYDVLEVPHISDVYFDFAIRRVYGGTVADTLCVVPFIDEPSKSTVYSIEWG